MGEHPAIGGTLAAMDGADPPVADVAVGEMGHVEHLAAPVVAGDDHAGARGVDRNDLGGSPVEAAGTVVVAGEAATRDSASIASTSAGRSLRHSAA